ncbi:hypothetical protein K501DRAFT_266235 [Backusella circina FSU 941]|nr:hypothetical protein K501DRAFT_266235 [Backusella circina FSU 941]
MDSHNNNRPYFIDSINSIQETSEFMNSPPVNFSVADNGRSNIVSSRPLISTIDYRPELLSTTQKRPVIPSKRAAQNREAQKAFRKRREQHIKDLEVKVKQMDHWKQQLDTLRIENRTLKDRMMNLEKQVDTLNNSNNKLHNNSIVGVASFLNQREHRSVSLPTLNNSNNSLLQRTATSNKRSHSESSRRSSLEVEKDSRPLSLSHQTGFNDPLYNINSSTTHRHTLYDGINKRRKTAHQQGSIIGQAPSQMITNNADLIIINHNNNNNETQLMNENDFDPFFHQEFFPIDGNTEFVPTSGGQVLDDLFAMLQTRQRPQIPMLTATVVNHEDSTLSLNNLI